MDFRILDGFTFFNEYDVLEVRLKLLYDFVDNFIIVEADRTHAGMEKPYNFPAHKGRYQWAADKIIYLPIHIDISGMILDKVPDHCDPTTDYWKIEATQRSNVVRGCDGFDPFDLLILSDVDEIPSREVIGAFKNNTQLRASVPFVCQQQMFYYSLVHLRQDLWRGSIFTTVGMARTFGTQSLRNERATLPPLNPGGWHLSYFQDAEGIQNKIQSFAHQEFNRKEFLDLAHIEDCIRNGKDLFNRNITILKVGPECYPAYFYEITKPYKHFFSVPSNSINV